MMASSMSCSALAIHTAAATSLSLGLEPMNKLSTTRSRSRRLSDLRNGTSFLPPLVDDPSLWNMMHSDDTISESGLLLLDCLGQDRWYWYDGGVAHLMHGHGALFGFCLAVVDRSSRQIL